MTDLARMRIEPICPRCGNPLVIELEETDPPLTAVVAVDCDSCDWSGLTQLSVPQPTVTAEVP